jgi:GxxExxY protein
LCRELAADGLRFERQRPLLVVYKGEPVDVGYRIDVLVEVLVLLELKAVDLLLPIHRAQVMTYLKLTGLSLGLLINFNVTKVSFGVKRIVRDFPNLLKP